MTNRYVENDVGRAMTADQMQEYREACEAKAEGRDLPRLRWAFNVSIALVLVGLVLLLIAGITK